MATTKPTILNDNFLSFYFYGIRQWRFNVNDTDANDANTNFQLAENYFNGKGAEKSYEKAQEYFQKADPLTQDDFDERFSGFPEIIK